MIQNHKDQFCPMFPPKATCGCPMKKSKYSLQKAVVALPDFGQIFAKILKVSYVAIDDFLKLNLIDCFILRQIGYKIQTSETNIKLTLLIKNE